MDKHELSIVVFGYDPYCDIWPYFDFFFSQTWPDCDYSKYFVSIDKAFQNTSGFVPIVCGESSFSGRGTAVLKHIKTKYVLVLFEDYLLVSKPDEAVLSKIVQEMDTRNIVFCSLDDFIRRIPLKKPPKGQLIGSFKKRGRFYLMNLQAGIWSTQFLFSFLENNYVQRPWDFEVMINEARSKGEVSANIGGMFKSGLKTMSGIDKGLINYRASLLFEYNSLPKPERKTQTKKQYLLQRLRNALIRCIPRPLKFLFMKIFKIQRHSFK